MDYSYGLSSLDVCSNEDLPEVELVSLLEEQLPQYRLRVDSLFLYENQDWTRSPNQQQHASDALSPVLAEETFRYMSEYFFTLVEFVHWNKNHEYLGVDFKAFDIPSHCSVCTDFNSNRSNNTKSWILIVLCLNAESWSFLWLLSVQGCKHIHVFPLLPSFTDTFLRLSRKRNFKKNSEII